MLIIPNQFSAKWQVLLRDFQRFVRLERMDALTRWKQMTKDLQYTEDFECPQCHKGVLHYTTIEPYPEGLDEAGRKTYRRMSIEQCGTCKAKFLRPYD